MLEDAIEHTHRMRFATGNIPELGPIVKIERNHGTCRFRRLHSLDDHVRRRRRQRRKNAAAMEPAYTAGKYFSPIEIAGLEHAASLVSPVVEHHRRAHTLPAVAIDRGHVRSVDAVVLEALVERFDTHRAHGVIDQFADRIVDHRRDDAGLEAETRRQVRRAVEFAAADVNIALCRTPKGNDAGVKTVNQCPKRHEIQSALRRNIQPIRHITPPRFRSSESTRMPCREAVPRPSRAICNTIFPNARLFDGLLFL